MRGAHVGWKRWCGRLARWGLGGAAVLSALLWMLTWWGQLHVVWRDHLGVSFEAGDIVIDDDPWREDPWGEDDHEDPPRWPIVAFLPYRSSLPLIERMKMTLLLPWTEEVTPSRHSSNGWMVYVQLWIPVVACGVPAGIAWWMHARRRIPGRCAKCRYDLSGIPGDRPCPECGTAQSRGGVQSHSTTAPQA